jgi:TonB family protein
MTRARVLSAADAVAGRRAPAARWLLLSGVAATALALVVFIATAMDVGAEKEAYERWQASGGDAQRFDWKHRSGLGDALVFGGLLAGAALLALGLGRRGKANPNFVIGSDAGVDAPVDPRYVGASAHPLVAATPAGYVVNVTPEMKGEVYLDGQSYPLAALVAERGSSFSLPPAGQARLDCGDSTFTIRATSRPRTLDVPLVLWDRRFTSYLTASLATLTLFMIMIFSVPPDPRSLSLDMLALDHAFIAFRIKPPEEKKEDLTFLNHNDKDQGGTGKRHAGTEGRMGDKKAKKPTGLYAIVGPKDNQNPQLAKQLAVDAAKTAGLLGVLKAVEGSHIASIFGTDRALGSDAENVLGGLIGNEIANAYGLDGLGVTGTGSGGGGTGEGTIGTGRLGTMGKGGGNGKGAGYGSGAGGLGRYRARAPEVTPGIASVRGSLDREIIRRIIRRHINEVKYCYEQELPKRPGLGGRIMVQFTISGTGQVISSVLQSSTMGNVRVESCTVQAVRRWDFPAPLGGGLVIVSYPFVLTPAGTGE